jgi:hypothetical protein
MLLLGLTRKLPKSFYFPEEGLGGEDGLGGEEGLGGEDNLGDGDGDGDGGLWSGVGKQVAIKSTGLIANLMLALAG